MPYDEDSPWVEPGDYLADAQRTIMAARGDVGRAVKAAKRTDEVLA